MRTFLEWLYEQSSQQIVWTKQNKSEWNGRLDIGNIVFVINFWQSMLYGSNDWNASFGQSYQTQPVSMPDLIQLFQAIDQGLIEFFQANPNVHIMNISPEATTPTRKDTVRGRQPSEDDPFAVFDLAKFNAYQYLFQHSELKKRGFEMHNKGKELVIVRPENVAIAS